MYNGNKMLTLATFQINKSTNCILKPTNMDMSIGQV